MVVNSSLKQQLEELFVHKAPATVVGWIWKAALVLSIERLLSRTYRPQGRGSIRETRTVAGMAARDAGGPGPVVLFLYRFLVYVVLLFAAAFSANMVRRKSSGTKRGEFKRKTLIAGLGLIPAWAFKDVVVSFLGIADDVTQLHHNTLWAAIVLVFATLVALILPTPEENSGFIRATLSQAGASMGLGVAFAFNEIFKSKAGDDWSVLIFQLIYSPVVTGVMVLVRPRLASFVGRQQQPLSKRFATFLFGVSGFIVAWAWNALLFCIYDSLVNTSDLWMCALWRCFWALAVTLIATFLILMGQGYTSATNTSANNTSANTRNVAAELLVLSAGINVGSVWSDTISAVYDAWGGGVGRCWLLVALISVAVPSAAFFLSTCLEVREEAALHDNPELPHVASNPLDASADTDGGDDFD